MPFIGGKWIHHNDCTWCQDHQELPLEMNKGRVTRVAERCGRHNRPVPPPGDVGRYCKDYTQRECGCNSCTPFVSGD